MSEKEEDVDRLVPHRMFKNQLCNVTEKKENIILGVQNNVSKSSE